MWRRTLQVSAGLLCVHALLTFGFAALGFPGTTVDRMAFAQHGFNFVFVALLNLALLRPVAPAFRTAVLVADGVFCLNCAAFLALKPEPPAVLAFVLTLLVTVGAVGDTRAAPRTT